MWMPVDVTLPNSAGALTLWTEKPAQAPPAMDPCSAQNTWEIFLKAENKHPRAVTVTEYPPPVPIPKTIHFPHLFKTKTNYL